MTAKAHVRLCFAKHARFVIWMLSKLWSCEIYKRLRTKKKILPLFLSKSRPKNGKKAFSCESAADLALSDKSSFYSQDEWLQEIEECECKPNTLKSSRLK